MKLLSLVTTVILSTSCGSKSSSNNSSQEIDVEQTDENGMVRGKFLGGTDQLQRLTVGSGNLAGTEITFPAGSLNIDLELSISESSDQLASDDFLTAAGVDGELSNLGPSVNLNASGNVTLDQPFTLRLPTGNSNSLRLAGQNPLVFAKLKKGDSEEIFIFPSSVLVVEDGFAKFESKFFGIFQFAYSTVPVDSEKTIQDISTEIRVKGQKIDPITGWEDQQYSAFGITFDKEGLLTGYFKTDNGPFDYVVPELTNLKLVKDTGRRFFKLTGMVDDESTFIIYSSKTDALAMIQIDQGKFDLSLLQTSSFSYPPVTSSERTTDEYVGKYYGDSFQFEAADTNWSADKAKLKSLTRDVIEMTKVDSGTIKISGKILGKNIDEGSLSLAGETADYHRFHGSFEGILVIEGEEHTTRMMTSLDKKSSFLAICFDSIATKCFDNSAEIDGVATRFVFGYFVK